MRRTEDLVKDFALRFKVEKYYTNEDDLIKDDNVNAVYIATPPKHHLDQARKCLEAGKHVYIEKPLCRSFQETLQLKQAYDRAKLIVPEIKLFAAYYRRAQDKFLKLKSMLDNKIIGEILFVRHVQTKKFDSERIDVYKAWRFNPEISGGGLLFDLGCHTPDIFDFLFGEIDLDSIQSNFGNSKPNIYNCEDYIAASFYFNTSTSNEQSNKIICDCFWHFASSENIDSVEIIGNNGKITFSIFGNDPITLHHNVTPKSTKVINYEIYEHVQQPLLEIICKDINHNTTDSPSNIDNSLRVAAALDKVLRRI